MNLYYVQCNIGADRWDMLVVAGDPEQAEEIWADAFFGETPSQARASDKRFNAYLVNLHVQRAVPGYIEWGTFKFIPVELP